MEETDLLRDVVATHGARSWSKIASHIPGRNAKQCRERWSTFCDPEFKRDKWTAAEEDRLMELHKLYGNRWSTFSKYLNNRSPVAIRNRWMCIQRRNAETRPERVSSATPPPDANSSETQSGFAINWEATIDQLFNDVIHWPEDEFMLMM